jgi:hypothetical protein
MGADRHLGSSAAEKSTAEKESFVEEEKVDVGMRRKAVVALASLPSKKMAFAVLRKGRVCVGSA